MSADNGIIINRKKLEAYYWQGDFIDDIPIAKGKNLDELIDGVLEYIGDKPLEYGIEFNDNPS